ncbi:MAG TPA: dockerin type I domain-containing protein [Phycisphaerae bacterium]|nr:dockerin type I domain-containing protein [Phycisphaerae bacterium]
MKGLAMKTAAALGLAMLFSIIVGPAVLAETVVTEPILTFSGHTSIVTSVAYSPDGAKVLTGSGDKTARLWNAATGAHIRTFSGHTQYVWSVAFSPDGTNVLTGSYDKTARLWDAATGAHIRTFAGHAGGVWSVAFSPDGTKVLTGSYDNTARLWAAGFDLLVRSNPITGVSIGGDAPGVTDFTKLFSQASQSVTLTAPPTTLSGAVRYDFIRWEIDGQQQPAGQLSAQFTVDHSMTALAVYEIRKHTLAVNSQPVTGVSIGGGATDYSLVVDDQQTVNLSAPAGLFQNLVAYSFAFWKINGTPQPPRQTDIEAHIEADTTVEAVYELFGDVDIDCRVTILDLIFIRNRLNAGVGTDGNWRADVNQDGKINILDLIHVRNKLYSACP